ncbi:MAG: 6-phospho-alpha-glucosidase [Niallia nealsonii]|uniref:6-phospho-alpha-glucosidase n=1 Tax=Niallia circulans TaxID=1397 RepID=A0A941GFW6_NIACI|nr:6-phospho-alpha-glucosidase [Niallia circulans]MCB5239214.1 6-phospho-alpha-glucosidase [Niallia circulans]MDU1848264.1 6-phospho-alpha-glucosidase [Niallia nealsonii]
MKKFNVLVVGGGSTWTPGLLKGICARQKTFPINRLVMFDVNENRQKTIGEFAKILFQEEYPEINFDYTVDKEKAFAEDIDFVFVQMRTGGYAMREKDEKIPLSLGLIGQETCGPGGFAYGMRSISDMVQLVKDVREKNKNAWILNYTNPAAIVADALQRIFPEDKKILNICDQPENLLRSYGRLLDKDPREFDPVYFGLNHFGWFTHLYDQQGNDLLPELRELILEGGFRPVDYEQRDKSWLETYAMVEQMVRDFPDYLPNTYLQYYLYPDKVLNKLNPSYTRANEVMDGREKRVFEECSRIISVGSAKDSHVVHNDAHGEFILIVAESIAFNKGDNFVVILKNEGIIDNLPHDAMVEVAASLTANGPRPYAVGTIPTFYKGLIEGQYAYERLTAEAYIEGSYQKALQALTLNRTVVSALKAREVLDALIEANKEYWPELK